MTDGGDSAVLDDEKIDALMLATVKSSAGKHVDRSEVLNTLGGILWCNDLQPGQAWEYLVPATALFLPIQT